ncbi:arginine--tRNA ligase [Merismopedia glauca]|uniref:Arginine--tRNA ligase n=1 Tax=Merismopedia glauca CCAP 1448/3 TaxID=1296344 RepID=A0A2T1BY99_9CYAN|nr:arginine--tRNA ligase [Merismopedia glauca]PSB00878.1 arginine--tRNA ligase [Merismopedia glauca CCAP 1448/3]
MDATTEELKKRFAQALEKSFGNEYRDLDPMIVVASNPLFGDYQANLAMSLSKKLKQPPKAIAQSLVANLAISDFCEPVSIAGPGFINIKLQPAYLEKQLQKVYEDTRLGIEPAKSPQRVIVDFSSPNIAKEMHVGHLRSTIIGDCLARILEFRGHKVLRINHVGDWGTQFGMLIAYLKEAYPEALTTQDALDLGDLVTLYRQAKQRFDSDITFQEIARESVVKLQSGDVEARKAWELLCIQSRREFEIIYNLLDVKLEERGESFYNPLLSEVVKDLEATGLLVEDAGAKCVFLEGFSNKEGKPLPLIVQKSDGGYNYATTDLAALRYRIEVDRADRIIYVTDAGQSSHFAQVFQVAKRAGWLTDRIDIVHVPFGLVQGEDGKKLKTRSGDTVRLKDLLDEAIARFSEYLEVDLKAKEREESQEFKETVAKVVGISAVKYADLSQNRLSNYIFSYDKMLAPLGNTAPYILYAYARIRSIGRQGNISFDDLLRDESIKLTEEMELSLAKHLLQFSEALQEVEKDLFPNRICQYLFELSQKFNKFFEHCPVLKSAEPVRTSRLLLCDLTSRTLKLGLSLLGIDVLERM